ncbi:hypothetical protein EXIGLDRAFT_592507, partial [Exidia glandulosa HHB12029]
VCIDESAVNERTARRERGYSEVNTRCVQRELLARGTTFSMLPALSLDGIIALDVFEGAVNRERLLSWIFHELGPELNPYPGKHSVVIMDNCRTHHGDDIRHIIED